MVLLLKLWHLLPLALYSVVACLCNAVNGTSKSKNTLTLPSDGRYSSSVACPHLSSPETSVVQSSSLKKKCLSSPWLCTPPSVCGLPLFPLTVLLTKVLMRLPQFSLALWVGFTPNMPDSMYSYFGRSNQQHLDFRPVVHLEIRAREGWRAESVNSINVTGYSVCNLKFWVIGKKKYKSQ